MSTYRVQQFVNGIASLLQHHSDVLTASPQTVGSRRNVPLPRKLNTFFEQTLAGRRAPRKEVAVNQLILRGITSCADEVLN